MKNHLSAIRVLVSEENTAGTIAYLDTLTQQVQTFASISDTGNLIIDSLINGKFQSCSSDGIEFKCNLQIPRNLRFDPYILNIILGNLIDNALDAVRKEDCLEKYIDLKIQYTQRNLVIKLKNTYNGKLKKQGDNFLTTKDNPQIHGLGLKSVRNAVEKVGGIFDCNMTPGIFPLLSFFRFLQTNPRSCIKIFLVCKLRLTFLFFTSEEKL